MGWGNPWVGEVDMGQCPGHNPLGGMLAGLFGTAKALALEEVGGLLRR